MNRRTLLSLSGGSLLLGIGGCLDRGQGGDSDDDDDTENDSEPEFIPIEEIREAACTPPPNEEEEIEYTTAEYEDVSEILTDAEESDETPENFAVITTPAEAESRLNPERHEDDIWSFVDETSLEDQALLVWAGSWSNTSETSEVVGVTEPDPNTVHTYLCQYGSAGGNDHTYYAYLIRVDAPQNLQQAKLTFREASGHEVGAGISTREETYERE